MTEQDVEILTRIYESGKRARASGVKRNNCPFKTRAKAQFWWLRGWADQAHEEKQTA